MNILLINNFYYNRGGDCTYLFSLKELLEAKGHKVSIFSMDHPLNYESDYSKYFVSYINYEDEIRTKSVASGFKVARRTIFSNEAKKKIQDLIKDEKPEIVHIQNIHHHITPSIFKVLKDNNIPIIWTLHDYTIVCPNTSFLAHGKICERCKKRKFFWPSIIKCKKGSFAASTMAAIEIATHMMMRFYDDVDYFIAPSEFLRLKLIEYGYNEEKIKQLNNFTMFSEGDNKEAAGEKYFIYLGRISSEKGVKTLIDAAIMSFAGANNSGYKLKIVGNGPLRNDMKAYVKSRNAGDQIEIMGHKNHAEAMDILRNSSFLVIPSEWYENFPYSVLESFQLGKPVIASRIGGIPELVKNWETGLLFETGNTKMLSGKISFFLSHPEKAEAIGKVGKDFMFGEINAENHYLRLMEIYMHAIKKKSEKRR